MQQDSIESYRRVRGRDFSSRFYEKLLADGAEMRRAFARTNFDRQHDLFEHGVLMLLEYAHGSAMGKLAMHRMGELHGRARLDVAPHLYEVWIRCLLETVAESDPEWSPVLEAAWRADVRKGIDFIVAAYDAPGPRR